MNLHIVRFIWMGVLIEKRSVNWTKELIHSVVGIIQKYGR